MIFGGTVPAQRVDQGYRDGEVYFKSRNNFPKDFSNYDYSIPTFNAIMDAYDVRSIEKPFGGIDIDLENTYRIRFGKINKVDFLIIDLSELPFIEYAEKVPLVRSTYTPNDYQQAQWYLTKINAPAAWNISQGDITAVIAVVDNGVLTSHSDLQPNLWQNPGETPGNALDDDQNGYVDDVYGYDVSDRDSDPSPPAGIADNSAFVHGTHVAGIASAATDNAVGISSLGFHSRIMAVKCASDSSPGDALSHPYDGVMYAIRARASIINMSWGGTASSITEQKIIELAYRNGIILVASAGNNNLNDPFYPAAYPHVIAVGATDISDSRASFSNYGNWVDVMAPGVNIYSTLAGSSSSYGSLSGTSMSCPLVSALAALLVAIGNTGPDKIEYYIKNGSDDISASNQLFLGQVGTGRINAHNSLIIASTINEFIAGTDIVENIYPNPSDGYITIEFSESAPMEVELRLYNNTGTQVIFKKKLDFSDNVFSKEIDLSAIDKGVYFIEISSNERPMSRDRIILQ